MRVEADNERMTSSGRRRLLWIVEWLSKGSWAVLDQALYALSQFLVNLLLARWLTPAEFGVYALLYSVLLFVASVHSALITEPMLVFAATRFAGAPRQYLRELVRSNFAITGLAGGGLLIVVAVMAATRTGSPTVAAIVALTVAQPFVLLTWLYRRACYVRASPPTAASGGAIYLVVVTSALFALQSLGWLSVPAAFLISGAAGLAASLWMAWRLRNAGTLAALGPTLGEVLRSHWEYGKWSLPTGLITWTSYNLYFLLLPAFAGWGATGALKALLNLVTPATHAIAALSLLLLPLLSRQTVYGAFREQVRRALIVFTAGCIAYGVVVGALSESVLRIFYGDSYPEYLTHLNHRGLLWLIAFLPLGGGVVSVLGSALRALERPDSVFKCYVVSATIGAVVGVPAIAWAGVDGAIVGTAVYVCATSIALAWSLRAGLSSWKRAPRAEIRHRQDPRDRHQPIEGLS
jgi:O-antigen/teichoic acid export membrane protein